MEPGLGNRRLWSSSRAKGRARAARKAAVAGVSSEGGPFRKPLMVQSSISRVVAWNEVSGDGGCSSGREDACEMTMPKRSGPEQKAAHGGKSGRLPSPDQPGVGESRAASHRTSAGAVDAGSFKIISLAVS